MKAEKLYQHLEKDFISTQMSDEWAKYMGEIKDYLSENFKKRSMGLVCDFAKEINKVYTAVFPTKEVMHEILDNGAKNAMLFVHHPSIWDITKAPNVFYLMDKELLQKFKEKKISIYNLHVPLDNYGSYSTSKTLADALGIVIEKPFFEYSGGLAGVIGKTNSKTIHELKKVFEKAVGHKVILYDYGDKKIKDQRIAIVAGGGNDLSVLEDIKKENINVFITGISAKNDHSKNVHEFEKENKISVLGGTHYSTETFACIAICNYFKKLGLPSEFIKGKAGMEDL